MAKAVADFWPRVSYGLLGYDMSRTHSIMRIATTASPVSGMEVREKTLELGEKSARGWAEHIMQLFTAKWFVQHAAGSAEARLSAFMNILYTQGGADYKVDMSAISRRAAEGAAFKPERRQARGKKVVRARNKTAPVSWEEAAASAETDVLDFTKDGRHWLQQPLAGKTARERKKSDDEDVDELLKQVPTSEELARVQDLNTSSETATTAVTAKSTPAVSFKRQSITAPTASSKASANVAKAV